MREVALAGRLASQSFSEAVAEKPVVLKEVVTPETLNTLAPPSTPPRPPTVTVSVRVTSVQGAAPGPKTATNGRIPISAEIPRAATRAAASPGLEERAPPALIIRGRAGVPPGQISSEGTEG